ncbi:MAG: DNRLRE domain-containing protein [Anaerolineae bacterium]|nr:DNRLRE domain-containing protein [Anaerolineae bacterium]
MKTKHAVLRMAVAMVLVILTFAMAAGPGQAAIEIPAGATINSATLSVYADFARSYTVYVYRVTAPWEEMVVTWNNFGGAYDPVPVASFTPTAGGWNTVDVTGLVEQWIGDVYPNYGFLLHQDQTPYQRFYSSEWADAILRPKLEVCYTPLGGGMTCYTLQRPGDIVADSSIYENMPDQTYGASPILHTGILNWYQKPSLIRFELPVTPPPPPCEGCTPGYWKNHLEAWAATDYSPSDDFDATFGVDLFNPNITLEQAVNARGGGVNRLARHGTAALLSAAHPDVAYPYTVAEVIALVQAGDADSLEWGNELGCPLN